MLFLIHIKLLKHLYLVEIIVGFNVSSVTVNENVRTFDVMISKAGNSLTPTVITLYPTAMDMHNNIHHDNVNIASVLPAECKSMYNCTCTCMFNVLAEADFSTDNISIIIPSGNRTTSVAVTVGLVIDDDVDEYLEAFYLLLSAQDPFVSLGSTENIYSSLIVIIEDDEGTYYVHYNNASILNVFPGVV